MSKQALAGGTEVAIEWHGHPARAWMPLPLAARDLSLGVDPVRATERAAAEVRRVGDRLPGGWEPLARLLLRAEGIASSNIEGLHAPVAAVVAAEAGDPSAAPPAPSVADNLGVVGQCSRTSAAPPPSPSTTCTAGTRQLMRHSGLPPHLVGAVRDTQGWIGGRGPQDAAYVPPPAARSPASSTTSRAPRGPARRPGRARGGRARAVRDDPPLRRRQRPARAAPRALGPRPAARGGGAATHERAHRARPGGYLTGLYWFRVGELTPWVEWFAGVVAQAALSSLGWADEVDTLLVDWRGRIDDLRADAAARRVLDVLPSHPMLSVDTAASLVGISPTAARTALDVLTTRGILEEQPVTRSGPGRPRRWWLARGLVDLVGGWAR